MPYCSKWILNQNWVRHLNTIHAMEGVSEFLHFDKDLIDHDNTSLAKPFRGIKSDSDLKGIVKQYKIKPQKNYDPYTFFNEVKETVVNSKGWSPPCIQ